MDLKIILRENQRENQHANEQFSHTSNIGHITNKTQKNKWLDEQYGPTFTYTPTTQIHDRSISWFGTGTSIKRGGIKLA
jgi:hypothetical protein